MSGLWCEHFQEYANDSQMLDGVFAAMSWARTTGSPSIPAPRPGATFLVSSTIHEGNAVVWRRIFGGPKTGAGFGFRFFIDALPSVDPIAPGGHNISSYILGGFLTASGFGQMMAAVGSDGGIIFMQGGAGVGTATIVHRTPPVLTARTWQYLEMKCVPLTSGGSFEVRVNGSNAGTYTGNTDIQNVGEVSQAVGYGPDFQQYGIADLHAWDTNAGNGPSDFTGNVGVLRRELDADTAHADWALSTGATGWSLLVDQDDTTLIEADSPSGSPKSAFQAGSLPTGTSGILYQQVKFRGLKTDSADCDVAPSMISAGVETAVTGQHMTSLETWRWGIFGNDPNTSAPWALAAANASEPAVTRTA